MPFHPVAAVRVPGSQLLHLEGCGQTRRRADFGRPTRHANGPVDVGLGDCAVDRTWRPGVVGQEAPPDTLAGEMCAAMATGPERDALAFNAWPDGAEQPASENPRATTAPTVETVSYTHLRAHETDSYLVCRL